MCRQRRSVAPRMMSPDLAALAGLPRLDAESLGSRLAAAQCPRLSQLALRRHVDSRRLPARDARIESHCHLEAARCRIVRCVTRRRRGADIGSESGRQRLGAQSGRQAWPSHRRSRSDDGPAAARDRLPLRRLTAQSRRSGGRPQPQADALAHPADARSRQDQADQVLATRRWHARLLRFADASCAPAAPTWAC